MSTAYDDALPTQTIYAAERSVVEAIKRGGAAEFFGSTLDLDRCRIQEFTPAMLPVVQGMVEALYRRHGTGAPPTVRASRRAYRRAWYSPRDHEIVLPAAQWGWTSLVLMHELAHALTDGGHNQRQAHGREWRRMFAALVGETVGPEAGLLLAAAMDL